MRPPNNLGYRALTPQKYITIKEAARPRSFSPLRYIRRDCGDGCGDHGPIFVLPLEVFCL